jgi:hypothetical protein
MNFRRAFKLFTLCGLLCSQAAQASQTIELEEYDSEFNTTVKVQLTTGADGVKRIGVNYNSNINVCYNGGDVSPIELNIVFVTNQDTQTIYHAYPLRPHCPAEGAHASFHFDSKNGLSVPSFLGTSDPHIWDRLFPARADGSRWYALRIGFVRSHRGVNITHDNRGGEDYRLIFE